MEDKAKKKLALALKLEANLNKTLIQEIERVDFGIEKNTKSIERMEEDSLKLVDAINTLDQTKADKEDVDARIENIARMPGRPGNPGRDGKDYILTAKDKEEIAKLTQENIKIPVVEKVIERTEVIKEQPVIKNEIVKEIHTKELSIDTPEEIRNKLSSLTGTERLDAKHIKNLPESKIVYQNSGGVSSIKGLRAGTGISVDNSNVQYPVISNTSTPDLSGYVPYTGATTNVNLGIHSISTPAIANLTSNGFVKTSGGDGTLSVDTTTYPSGSGTANQVTYWSGTNTITGGASNTLVNGTTPETRLTETTNSEYTRLTKLGSASSYVATRYNRVNVVGGTGNAVNLVKASAQYVTVPDSSAFTFGNGTTDSPFSVSGWYYITDATDICLFAKGGASNYEYGVATVGDTLYVNMYSLNGATYLQQNTNSTITSLENTWAHIVITYSGSKTDAGIKVYINGSSVALTAGGSGYTGMNNGDKPLEIGRRFGASTYDFAGKIDEFVIYNVELSASDITTMYNAGVGVYTTPTANTLAIWHFDESAGTSATDSSGNAHTGTLVNSATFVTGKIATASAVAEAQVWKSQDGTNALENGIHTWGNTTGRSVIEGVLHNYNIGGSTKATWSTSGFVIADTLQNTGATTLIASGASVVPLTVKGASSQTANLQEWQNSSGTVLASVGKGGNVGILTPPSTNSAVNLDVYNLFASGNFYIKANAGSFDSLDLRAFMGKSGSWLGSADDNFIFASYKQKLLFSTNNSTNIHMTIDSTEVIVNDGGLSTIDFRVESDSNANAIFVDASADTVSLGVLSTNGFVKTSGGTGLLSVDTNVYSPLGYMFFIS